MVCCCVIVVSLFWGAGNPRPVLRGQAINEDDPPSARSRSPVRGNVSAPAAPALLGELADPIAGGSRSSRNGRRKRR